MPGGARRDVATAALRPSRQRTWRPANRRDRAAGPLAQVSRPAVHGRQGARWSFWDATLRFASPHWGEDRAEGLAVGVPWQRAAGRSPLGVWSRWSPAVTAITEPRGALVASSLRDSTSPRLAPQRKSKRRGRISVRALDRWAMIWVSRPTSAMLPAGRVLGKDHWRTGGPRLLRIIACAGKIVKKTAPVREMYR